MAPIETIKAQTCQRWIAYTSFIVIKVMLIVSMDWVFVGRIYSIKVTTFVQLSHKLFWTILTKLFQVFLHCLRLLPFLPFCLRFELNVFFSGVSIFWVIFPEGGESFSAFFFHFWVMLKSLFPSWDGTFKGVSAVVNSRGTPKVFGKLHYNSFTFVF